MRILRGTGAICIQGMTYGAIVYLYTKRTVWALRGPRQHALFSERNGKMKAWRLPRGWRVTASTRHNVGDY